MTEIEKHIKECEHRVMVITNSKFSKSDVGQENIRILKSAIEACGKQIPKKCEYDHGYYACPNCGESTAEDCLNEGYCSSCGQAIIH